MPKVDDADDCEQGETALPTAPKNGAGDDPDKAAAETEQFVSTTIAALGAEHKAKGAIYFAMTREVDIIQARLDANKEAAAQLSLATNAAIDAEVQRCTAEIIRQINAHIMAQAEPKSDALREEARKDERALEEALNYARVMLTAMQKLKSRIEALQIGPRPEMDDQPNNWRPLNLSAVSTAAETKGDSKKEKDVGMAFAYGVWYEKSAETDPPWDSYYANQQTGQAEWEAFLEPGAATAPAPAPQQQPLHQQMGHTGMGAGQHFLPHVQHPMQPLPLHLPLHLQQEQQYQYQHPHQQHHHHQQQYQQEYHHHQHHHHHQQHHQQYQQQHQYLDAMPMRQTAVVYTRWDDKMAKRDKKRIQRERLKQGKLEAKWRDTELDKERERSRAGDAVKAGEASPAREK